MIVEPSPTNPRSPARRALRVIGLTAPVLVLVGVVAVGALGPPPADRASEPPSTTVAPPDAARATQAPALLADGSAVPFPASWIGLRVRSVADSQAERAAGRATGIVAVAGYLTYGALPWTCMDAYLEVDRSTCEERALLVDQPHAVGGGAGATGLVSIGAHLHPAFRPGTRAPAPDDAPGSPRAEPIPVVVLGEFPDPTAACSPEARGCGEAFTVERVVWVAGTPWGPTLTVDPAMGVDPNIPEITISVDEAERALGRGALPLASSVVRPDVLATLDPAAAAALPAVPPVRRLQPLTYVRGLVFQFDASQPLYGRDPAIGWVVLDAITGELLARGGPTGPGSAPVGSTRASRDVSP